MQGQILTQTNGIFGLLGSAIKVGSDMEQKSHKSKVMKIYNTTKYTTVPRYQREYEVEYCFDDKGEIEIWSVDGNTDVEDTYSESFLKQITYKIKEKSNSDNDEEYDNHFQNYEVV